METCTSLQNLLICKLNHINLAILVNCIKVMKRIINAFIYAIVLFATILTSIVATTWYIGDICAPNQPANQDPIYEFIAGVIMLTALTGLFMYLFYLLWQNKHMAFTRKARPWVYGIGMLISSSIVFPFINLNTEHPLMNVTLGISLSISLAIVLIFILKYSLILMLKWHENKSNIH